MSIHAFDRLEHQGMHADWFVVNWCLGNTCNYACTYCPTSLHDGSKRWPPLDNVKAFIDRVRQLHPEKKLYFEFTGGEVTLNKDFIAICQHCRANDAKVGLISNGSRTLRWWNENKQHFDHVNLSFHAEFAPIDHFCEVVATLCRDVATHVNVMMHPDETHWVTCLGVARRVCVIGNASISLQPLLHDLANERYDYSAEQQYVFDHQASLFNVHYDKPFNSYYRGSMLAMQDDKALRAIPPNDFISSDTNNWLGWECWTGVEQLAVDKDGTIWRGWCRVGGRLGNVHDPELVLPLTPVVCDKSRCHCNFDIMCTKRRLPGGV